MARASSVKKYISEGALRKRIDVYIRRHRLDVDTSTEPTFRNHGWAAWWGFRLFDDDTVLLFDDELSALFRSYKKGRPKTWDDYNAEKRELLAKYLQRSRSGRHEGA